MQKALPLFLDDDGVTVKPLSKRQAKKKGLKYEDAMDLFHMVSSYKTEGLQSLGQDEAIRIGRKIAADYEYEVETGDRTAYTRDLIKAGILSDSDNIVDYQLSYQPFLDVTKATDVLANVDVELSELAAGDYDIQRDIAFERQQVGYDYTDAGDDLTGEMEAALAAVEGGVGETIGTETSDAVVAYSSLKNQRDATIDDIRSLSADIRNKQSLQRQGFDIKDEDIQSSLDSLSSLQKQSTDLGRGMRTEMSRSVASARQDKIQALADDILLESGLEATEQNIRAARARASDIVEAPGVSMFREQPPAPRGQVPFYDMYGRIKR